MRIMRYRKDDSKLSWIVQLVIIALILLIIKLWRDVKKLRRSIESLEFLK